MHQTLFEAQQDFLKRIDISYSYALAKRMEHFKTNEALGYRTAGSQAEFQTGEMLREEMLAIGLAEVTKDAFTMDGWEFQKAALAFYDRAGLRHSFELGGYQADFDTQGPRAYELMYAGRGTAAELDGLEVNGRLVLIDINQRRDWWINYPAYQAHLRGAAAVIAVQDEGYAQVDSTALNSQDICGPAFAPAFSISKAHASVLKGLIAAAGGGVVQVEFDALSQVRENALSYNIVGKLPGIYPDSMILMTAHYDSYFAGFQDDNAAVALMLGIARALVQSGFRPRHTLVFCAMAAEEWGVSDTRYDWSTGAYNQVFRVHPEWAGRTIAAINFELPAHAHHSCDAIRAVYELAPFLTEFAADVPPPPEVYPEGIQIVSPVFTWSDDFSLAIAGIPSLVNDFADGGFMQTHYHSQFDNDTLYDEPAYRYHHELYGQLLLRYDRCAVTPLDFTPRLAALRESLDPDLVAQSGGDYNAILRELSRAAEYANAMREQVWRINRDYLALLDAGDDECAARLWAQSQSLNHALLAAFRLAEDAFVRLTWHDEPIFPHQHPQNNLKHLAGALQALRAGDLARALDEHLTEIDNNWYALPFDDEVFRYFSDYVLHASDDRLMWGAGRVLGQEDLSETLRALAARRAACERGDGEPGLTVELAQQELQGATARQRNLLRGVTAAETAAVRRLATLLGGMLAD